MRHLPDCRAGGTFLSYRILCTFSIVRFLIKKSASYFEAASFCFTWLLSPSTRPLISATSV